jgi:hypothetical protein
MSGSPLEDPIWLGASSYGSSANYISTAVLLFELHFKVCGSTA